MASRESRWQAPSKLPKARTPGSTTARHSGKAAVSRKGCGITSTASGSNSMQTRHVGRSGLKVTTVGLGCNNFGWKIDQQASNSVVAQAVDLGVNLFDTADRYGTKPGDSEFVWGKALGPRRKEIVLLTKFGVGLINPRMRDSSRRYVMTAVEASLRRLNTDWIDVYMIHWPDYATPMEETLRALDDL